MRYGQSMEQIRLPNKSKSICYLFWENGSWITHMVFRILKTFLSKIHVWRWLRIFSGIILWTFLTLHLLIVLLLTGIVRLVIWVFNLPARLIWGPSQNQ